MLRLIGTLEDVLRVFALAVCVGAVPTRAQRAREAPGPEGSAGRTRLARCCASWAAETQSGFERSCRVAVRHASITATNMA
jgi:hypothetical protein